MRIIIILLAAIAIYSTAFYRPKCEHVFTEVEQATVTIEHPGAGYSIVHPLYSWPSGLKEGKELICVKCFHKQKQKIDYGQPDKRQSLSVFFDVNRGLFLNNESLVFDSVFLRPSAEPKTYR